MLPQYPHREPARRVPQHRRRPVRGRHRAERRRRATPHSSRGAAFGDFDNDGDIDVLVMNMNEPPSLLRNDYCGPATAGSSSRSKGTRSNRSAIGATVVVTAGGRTQAQAVLSQSSYYSHDDFRLHFGLGDQPHRSIGSRSRWPAGGKPDRSSERACDRPIVSSTIEEGRADASSCSAG